MFYQQSQDGDWLGKYARIQAVSCEESWWGAACREQEGLGDSLGEPESSQLEHWHQDQKDYLRYGTTIA